MADSMYTVSGMTCEHCARAVSEAIGAIPGVNGVDVDVASGRVRVNNGVPIDDAAVRDAVVGAGYTLVLP